MRTIGAIVSALTSWAAFKKTGQRTVVMGDMVLLEDQVNPVMSVALDNGLEVTALHNHFLWDSPRVLFMHIGGMGDEARLAAAVGKVLAKIDATSGGKGDVPHAEIDPAGSTLDPGRIDAILGQSGDLKNGVYKVTIGPGPAGGAGRDAILTEALNVNATRTQGGRPMKTLWILSALLLSLVVTMPAGLAQTDKDDDDDVQDPAALAKALGPIKVTLEAGVAAAKSQGKPISAKFELEDGRLQLSVYTEKGGKFFEVVVDQDKGTVSRSEPITEGDDLSDAKAQSGAMAKARRSLGDAVAKAVAANKGSARSARSPKARTDTRPSPSRS